MLSCVISYPTSFNFLGLVTLVLDITYLTYPDQLVYTLFTLALGLKFVHTLLIKNRIILIFTLSKFI